MDPSKLLPSVKASSGIVKSVKGGLIPNVKTTKTKTEEKNVKKEKRIQFSLRKELLIIRSKTIKIEKLLQSNFILSRRSFNLTRKQREQENREQREKRLESKKTKFGKIEIPSLPQFSFFDAIKRFVFFTFLGLALPTLFKIVPKIIELGKNLQPAIQFLTDIIGGIGKGLLGAFTTFIDWGYKIQDSTQSVVKQLGGNKAEKQFESFVRNLNTFIDLSILAGLTALDVGLDAERFNRKLRGKDGKPKPRGPIKPTTGRGGQKGLGRGMSVTTGKGGKPGVGRNAKVTIGGEGGKVPGWWNKILKGPFAKLKGPLSRFAGAAVPGLGAAVGAADAAARFSSGDKVGGVLASVSAALDVATAAAALTGIGLPIAGVLGTISMSIDVVLLIRDIIRTFFPAIPMFSRGGKIKLFTDGGRVGESGRSIKIGRKITTVTRKQEISPGKDVGGKKQILKLFPDPGPENKQETIRSSPWWKQWLGITSNQTTQQQVKGKPANPFQALTSTAKTLLKVPGIVGKLMSVGSLVPLGQKPERNLGKEFGNMMGRLTQDIIDNNINLSFGDIMKFISGYAEGGDLRNANIIRENNVGEKIGSLVGRAIDSMITSQIDVAIRDIYREVTNIGKPEDKRTPTTSPFDSEFPEDQYDYEVTGGELPSKYSGRGPESGHGYPAKDYPVEVGTAISVFVPGKVIRAKNYDPNGYGNEIIIQHENGLISQYAHLSKINVREGDIINKNTIIGLTGGQPGDRGAGKTTGPHLHFEVRDSGGKKITKEKSGDSYFRFGRVISAKLRSPSLENLRLTGDSFSGSASWYGRKDGFHGQTTANGETFNTDNLSAAIQIGLRNKFGGVSKGKTVYYAKVTNTQNGKSVVVRINDVGPLVPGGVIDLSEAAFKKISSNGSLSQGRIPSVKVEKLGAAPRTQASRPPSQPPQRQSSSITPVSGTKFKVGGTTIFKGSDGKYYSTEKDRIGNYLEVDKRSWEYAKREGSLVSSLVPSSTETKTPVSISPSKPTIEGLNEQAPYEQSSFNTSVAFVPIVIKDPVYIPSPTGVNNTMQVASIIDFTVTPKNG